MFLIQRLGGIGRQQASFVSMENSRLARCGGLNENGHPRLIYLNAVTRSGPVWEGLGGVALTE